MSSVLPEETVTVDLAPLLHLVTPAAATPRQLRRLVEAVAAQPGLWQPAVHHDQAQRHYRRIHADDRVDIWVNTWPDEADTTLHDHGGSSGAYCVVSGVLTEDWVRADAGQAPSPARRPRSPRSLTRRTLAAGTTIAFGPQHVHDVGSRDGSAAVSIHAYSPPLSSLNYYRLDEGRLAVTSTKQISELSSW